MKRLSARSLLVLLASLVLVACVPDSSPRMSGAQSPTANPASSSQGSNSAAEYCTQSGGIVETRYPFYGTNDQNPTQLAGTLQVCVFTAKDDGSRIMVAVDTLYADKPTLAASAYLNKPTIQGGGQPSTNPSSLYCSQLGGTDLFGGITAAGGGWAKAGAEDPISMCVFPDLSVIDSWGITYHSNGTIRGADLTKLFRAPTTK